MYKVVKSFADLQDNGHKYNVGDSFPREGLEVSDARVAKLAGTSNRQGVALIEEVKEKAKSLNLTAPAPSEKVEPEDSFDRPEPEPEPKKVSNRKTNKKN